MTLVNALAFRDMSTSALELYDVGEFTCARLCRPARAYERVFIALTTSVFSSSFQDPKKKNRPFGLFGGGGSAWFNPGQVGQFTHQFGILQGTVGN